MNTPVKTRVSTIKAINYCGFTLAREKSDIYVLTLCSPFGSCLRMVNFTFLGSDTTGGPKRGLRRSLREQSNGRGDCMG